MKKVFWGILLAMVNLGSYATMLLMVLLGDGLNGDLYRWLSAAGSLSVALGYLLIMAGAQDLPSGNFGWAATFSKILCAYTAAMAVLGALSLTPGGVIAQILYWAADLGSFLTMYFCVLGVADLERSSRAYLWADKLRTCFTVWVVLNLLSNFITVAAVAALAAYVVMLVYFAKAAHAYKSGGGWRVL